MLHVLYASLFSVFWLALLDSKINLGIFKAPLSLLLSGIGDWHYFKGYDLIVIIPATAFLALFIMTLSDRFADYRPAVIQNIRREL